MVIGVVWGKFIMSFFREYILEVLALVWESCFLGLCFLGNLGGDDDFSNSFSGKPVFPFPDSLSGL